MGRLWRRVREKSVTRLARTASIRVVSLQKLKLKSERPKNVIASIPSSIHPHTHTHMHLPTHTHHETDNTAAGASCRVGRTLRRCPPRREETAGRTPPEHKTYATRHSQERAQITSLTSHTSLMQSSDAQIKTSTLW
mmetsp:Transcript_28563/g.82374  ORF Transcript_28563/g.82374 Transcript_28563/m.82374 type:complete len:137 (-) Transcript_28563:1914-2324(-)